MTVDKNTPAPPKEARRPGLSPDLPCNRRATTTVDGVSYCENHRRSVETRKRRQVKITREWDGSFDAAPPRKTTCGETTNDMAHACQREKDHDGAHVYDSPIIRREWSRSQEEYDALRTALAAETEARRKAEADHDQTAADAQKLALALADARAALEAARRERDEAREDRDRFERERAANAFRAERAESALATATPSPQPATAPKFDWGYAQAVEDAAELWLDGLRIAALEQGDHVVQRRIETLVAILDEERP